MKESTTSILQNHAMPAHEPKVFAERLAALMSAESVDDNQAGEHTVGSAVTLYLKSAYRNADAGLRRGRHVRRFIEFLPDGRQTDIAQLTDASLELAMANMRKAACGEMLSAYMIARYFIAVRSMHGFLTWAVGYGLIPRTVGGALRGWLHPNWGTLISDSETGLGFIPLRSFGLGNGRLPGYHRPLALPGGGKRLDNSLEIIDRSDLRSM